MTGEPLGEALARLRSDVPANDTDCASPFFRSLPKRPQDAGDTAPDDEDADEIDHLVEEGRDDPVGLIRVFVCRATVVDGPVPGMLADV